MIRTFLRTIMFLAVWLIVFDVIGVIACVIFDVVPFRGSSGALPYAIWFVLGIFAGSITVMSAGERREEETRTGRTCGRTRKAVSFLTSLAMLGALPPSSTTFIGAGASREYFVPDSAPHTITYFVSILAQCCSSSSRRPKPSH
jgi:hypothetical protein